MKKREKWLLLRDFKIKCNFKFSRLYFNQMKAFHTNSFRFYLSRWRELRRISSDDFEKPLKKLLTLSFNIISASKIERVFEVERVLTSKTQCNVRRGISPKIERVFNVELVVIAKIDKVHSRRRHIFSWKWLKIPSTGLMCIGLLRRNLVRQYCQFRLHFI